MFRESAMFLPIWVTILLAVRMPEYEASFLLKWLQNMALTSRMWLSAGVFCFGMSIVLGYHQDQLVAHNAMAKKIGMPPTVLIQDFNQSRHSNILNEVQLLGEAALPQIITTNIGTETAPNWVQLLPLYPVGAESLPFANKFFADASKGPRRPMPRAASKALSERAWNIRPLEDKPMGMILIESGVSIEEAVLYRRVGQGANGPLVAITGSLLASPRFHQKATSAFGNDGIWMMTDVPLIVPYMNGLRVTGPSTNYDSWRSVLEWMAVVMILAGIANAFHLVQRLVVRRKPEPVFEKVEAVGAFPGVFQAIRTQEDIVREEQEEAEREAAATRRTFSRITYG